MLGFFYAINGDVIQMEASIQFVVMNDDPDITDFAIDKAPTIKSKNLIYMPFPRPFCPFVIGAFKCRSRCPAI